MYTVCVLPSNSKSNTELRPNSRRICSTSDTDNEMLIGSKSLAYTTPGTKSSLRNCLAAEVPAPSRFCAVNFIRIPPEYIRLYLRFLQFKNLETHLIITHMSNKIYFN